MNLNLEILQKLRKIEGEVEKLKRLEGISSNLLDAYPVGAIYISVVSTSPAILFGGTWQSFGAGRVLVGVDVNDTDFDTVEKTGGEKTHTLTIAEMPSHSHTGTTGTETAYASAYGITYFHTGSKGLASGSYDFVSTAGGYTHKHSFTTANAGSGGAHNNLQPYIVVYMWKRTA